MRHVVQSTRSSASARSIVWVSAYLIIVPWQESLKPERTACGTVNEARLEAGSRPVRRLDTHDVPRQWSLSITAAALMRWSTLSGAHQDPMAPGSPRFTWPLLPTGRLAQRTDLRYRSWQPRWAAVLIANDRRAAPMEPRRFDVARRRIRCSRPPNGPLSSVATAGRAVSPAGDSPTTAAVCWPAFRVVGHATLQDFQVRQIPARHRASDRCWVELKVRLCR